jgi:hypothetical protein
LAKNYEFEYIFWPIFDQKMDQLQDLIFLKTENNSPFKFSPPIFNLLKKICKISNEIKNDTHLQFWSGKLKTN